MSPISEKTLGSNTRQGKNRVAHNEKGITLIEVLAATVISVLVITAATLFFTGIYGMWGSSSNKFTLDTEKKQIAGLFTGRFAEATAAEVGPNIISFTLNGNTHQLTLSAQPNSTLQKLTYTYGGSDPVTWTLSEHIDRVLFNGMDLNTLNSSFSFANGEVMQFEFHFALNKSHDTFAANFKLLRANIAGQD